jgi:hypothetical protein
MKKFLSVLLAMVLMLGLALPVQASRLQEIQQPESFDFSIELTMELDMLVEPEHELMMALILGGPDITANVTGSVVTDGAAASQMSVEMVIGTGILGVVPIRMWFDVNMNDFANPTMLMIVELPAMLRMLLAMENPALNRQFLVLDASEFLAEELADIAMPTEEELEALMEEAMAELRNIDRGAIMDQLAEFIEVLDFSFDFTQNDDGYLTGLNLAFDVVLDPNAEAVGLEVAFDVEISNINNAVVEFPALTPENSFDLLTLE